MHTYLVAITGEMQIQPAWWRQVFYRSLEMEKKKELGEDLSG